MSRRAEDTSLRARTIRLAHQHPILRPHLVPLLKQAGALPPDFDSVEEALTWIKSHYERFRCGGWRCVYNYDAQHVIKVALEHDAVEMNHIEVDNLRCLGADYAPEVKAWDRKHYYWLVVEKVKPVTPAEYLHKLVQDCGIPEDILWDEHPDLSEWLIGALKGRVHPVLATDMCRLMDNKWFSGLVAKLKHCDVDPGDMGPKNWGISASGNLVILDAGGKWSDTSY